VKLLIDEMWSQDAAAQLRRRGFDVESVHTNPELKSKSDSILLSYSIQQDRAIVTENVDDFRRLVEREFRSGHSHPGLVFTAKRAFDRGGSRAIGRLVLALQALLESDIDLTNLEWWLRPVD
jgi:uncharacterized protein DUF5615